MKQLVLSLSLAFTCLLVFVYCLEAKSPAEVKADLPDISLTKITTNIESIKDKRTDGKGLANIIDNNPKTFYWTGAQARKGQVIHFKFNKPIPKGKTLKIYTGFAVENSEDGDMLQDSVLESSVDSGRTWKPVSQFHCGHVEVQTPYPAADYRIRVLKSRGNWAAIRHLSITDNALTQKTIRGKAKLKGKTYDLSITTDFDDFPGSNDPKLKERFATMSKLYFEVWPHLVTWLNADATRIPKHIDISFVSTLTHPAHAGGHTMTMLTKHLLNQPEDVEGVFVHELAHIIQAYPNNPASWFVEGSADYVRYRKFPNRKWANIQRKHMNNKKPLGLYWHSACFLLWMEDTYKKPITATVSKAIYHNNYNEKLFKELTGKTLQELAADYKKSNYRPALDSPKR